MGEDTDVETQTKPTRNISQKSVKETGYSQPEKGVRVPPSVTFSY